jgi:cytochrome c peroxidase
MRIVKLFVIFSFSLFFLISFQSRYFSPVASGQSAPSAPTGFSATFNIHNNKVALYWDTIRGATAYRVFRNTVNDPQTAADIGVTPAPFFFDRTAVQGQTYFYWVRAENGSSVSELSETATGRRAVAENNGPISPLEPPPPAPAANPLTATKAYLGKALFWDEQLSSTRTVACGTCHTAGSGGTDPRSLVDIFDSRNPGFDNIYNTADDVVGSMGVPLNNADGTYSWSSNYGLRAQVTPRKANSHINAAYEPLLFWDGRATGTFRDPLTNAVIINGGGALESQVVSPPVSDTEMAHAGRNWTEVAAQISASKPLALATDIPPALERWIDGRSYPELFEEAFGTPEVTPARIAMAIASYERTLFSDQTPLDLADAGIQPLPPAEARGRDVFLNTQCTTCHVGSLMTDNTFRNIGVRPVIEDTGRHQVTGSNGDLGEFRVPGLRNVGLRSSFMHNGRFATLEEVVEFYNRGGDFPNEPNFAGQFIRPRNLSAQQKADLVVFLRDALTDPRVAAELPPFDRPRLYSESNRVPVVFGTGRAGSGGHQPKPVAIEPPLAGNPSFTVAVSDALGSAQAVLVIDSSDPGVGSTIPASGSFTRQTITLQGSGAGAGYGSVSISIPDDPALVGQTFYGRWYVVDPAAANGFSVSQAFRFTVFGAGTSASKGAAHVDFDGDGRTDISIFRPSPGQWWINSSSTGSTTGLDFGASTDRIVPADYTGDGKTDVAVFRPSTGEWFVLRSEDSSFYAFPFGGAGDVPLPADYDGDGKADPTVFRPSGGHWYSLLSGNNGEVSIRQFGSTGDVPVTGDYDGDGRFDIGVFRPVGTGGGAEWWIERSSEGLFAVQFGLSTDKPVAQDYTGDGRTDVAFWRPETGTWYVLRSEDVSYYAFPFGEAGDIPAPGDYDGDGRADAAVFRVTNATWYSLRSTQGLHIETFGLTGDQPAPAAFVP